MTRPGRPRLAVRPVVLSVKLMLYPGQDDDLIAYLTTAGPRLRATLVKLAMRRGAVLHPMGPAGAGEEEGFDAFDQLLQ